MEAPLSQGESVGIKFRFGGNTGNTLDSHRLIFLAKRELGLDAHNRVVEEIEKSYFEDEGNITSRAMLTAAATRAGLDQAQVTDWSKSAAGHSEVENELQMGQMRGVSGVPNFVLQDKYEIGGAQDADAFVGIFEEIKQIK